MVVRIIVARPAQLIARAGATVEDAGAIVDVANNEFARQAVDQ